MGLSLRLSFFAVIFPSLCVKDNGIVAPNRRPSMSWSRSWFILWFFTRFLSSRSTDEEIFHRRSVFWATFGVISWNKCSNNALGVDNWKLAGYVVMCTTATGAPAVVEEPPQREKPAEMPLFFLLLFRVRIVTGGGGEEKSQTIFEGGEETQQYLALRVYFPHHVEYFSGIFQPEETDGRGLSFPLRGSRVFCASRGN